MDLADAVRSRRSIKSFRTDRPIEPEKLRRVFDLVRETPSSFNLQHWRFVVVQAEANRRRLQAAAYGQRHVGEAPCVVVVAARLDAHREAARANAHTPPEPLRKLVPVIDGYYEGHPHFQRDEAIRSASLASMTLMLAAEAEGLSTCPMIGYDPRKVSDAVGLDERHIPVMMIVLGYAGELEPFPTSRFPLAETVKFETLDGKGMQ